ncbi:MAG: hypothetical protein PVI28_19500 [Gammaproteobacteria bacterium]|jgi:hypothetical protein
MGTPSSSSSPAEWGAKQFILASLEKLRDEHPQVYERLCASLAPRTLLLTIDGEPVRLRFEAQRHINPDRLPEASVHLETTRETILAVIDAHYSLEGAVEAGLIELTGATEDLSAFHDGLLLYVRGAVRCPSFPSLLERYRRGS